MTREEKKNELIALFVNGAMPIGELIDECFEYGQQHPHWISVEDEFPKDSGDVLVLTKGGNMLVTLGTYDEGEWVWCFYSPKDYITHWMPLPQQPVASKF